MHRSVLRPRDLWRALAIGVVVLFALRTSYFVLQDAVDGIARRVGERAFDELTGAILAVVPVGGTFLLSRRFPLLRPLRRGTALVYAAAFVALSALHTTGMIALRAALAPALGMTRHDLTFTAARYAYEAANDVVFYVAALALLALAEHVVASRERERRAAALERSLLRAELSTLRLQLQPHFLFNALNTISSTMYEDVDAADALLGELAELLRASLRTTHTQEVPARDELALLDRYVALMRARFGARLSVRVDAPADVADLLVPSMLLQPLVENAVRHGGVTRAGRGEIVVRLRRDAGALECRVTDRPSSYVGALAVERGEGTGLATTARRLRLLYGEAQAITAGATGDGAFALTVRIPARALA